MISKYFIDYFYFNKDSYNFSAFSGLKTSRYNEIAVKFYKLYIMET